MHIQRIMPQNKSKQSFQGFHANCELTCNSINCFKQKFYGRNADKIMMTSPSLEGTFNKLKRLFENHKKFNLRIDQFSHTKPTEAAGYVVSIQPTEYILDELKTKHIDPSQYQLTFTIDLSSGGTTALTRAKSFIEKKGTDL